MTETFENNEISEQPITSISYEGIDITSDDIIKHMKGSGTGERRYATKKIFAKIMGKPIPEIPQNVERAKIVSVFLSKVDNKSISLTPQEIAFLDRSYLDFIDETAW